MVPFRTCVQVVHERRDGSECTWSRSVFPMHVQVVIETEGGPYCALSRFVLSVHVGVVNGSGCI